MTVKRHLDSSRNVPGERFVSIFDCKKEFLWNNKTSVLLFGILNPIQNHLSLYTQSALLLVALYFFFLNSHLSIIC